MVVFISGGLCLTTEDGSLFHTTVGSGGTKGCYEKILWKYFVNFLKWTKNFYASAA